MTKEEEVDQLRVQLAGCLMAAEGARQEVFMGDYGWSPAYQKIIEIRKAYEKQKAMLPSEALFGFAGWLTSLKEPITFSAHHEAGLAADLVEEYIKANNLEYPRDGIYPNNLKYPVTRKSFDLKYPNADLGTSESEKET